MRSITLFGHTVSAGQTAFLRAPVTELVDGTVVSVPVMVLVGVSDGPTVLLSGAVHGDEYHGPAAIPALMKGISADELSGILIGIPIMNPLSYFTKERVASLDYEHLNLNRIWPGDPNGFVSLRLAAKLFEEVVLKADYIFDYHEGGIAFLADYIILGGTAETRVKVGETQRQMAKWFGTLPVFDSTTDAAAVRLGRAGALSEAAGSRGIPVIGIEIGGAGTVWPEWVEKSVAGSRRILQGLKLLGGTPEPQPGLQYFCPRAAWPRPAHGGLLRPLPAARMHAVVDAGTPLADVLDPFGNVVETLVAPFRSVIMDTRFIATVMPGDWTYHCGQIVE